MSGQDLRANPYVGLRPFFADDSLYFFGREQQTAELLDILRAHRFLGVVGSSGSGKSSLVRAGLLPGLLGGFLVQDRDRWRTVQMKPGDAPIGNLALGLLEATGQTTAPEAVATLEQAIREGHTGAVVKLLTTRLESNANLFLLVDQFEEIFTFRGIQDDDSEKSLDLGRRKERARRKAEAADFVDLLLALAEQRDLPIYVALTMRTDFLGDCDLFHGLPEALNRGRYLVPRMTREQSRDAVECPALLLGAQVAPRLLDHLLNELGDRFDRLPVLQHALLRTWGKWQGAGSVGPVDLRHYKSAGGLEGALDQDAERALKGLDIGVTARVFKRLTDTDLSQRRVRSPARISELVAAAGVNRGTVEEIVRRFEEDGRSFVHRSADGKPDDPRVDISHESLIRQWVKLRDWVDEERRSRDEYVELVKKARERGAAALLQDPELQMAVDWKEKASPSPGWAQRYSAADGDFKSAMGYLDESHSRAQAAEDTKARHRRVWVFSIAVVFFVMLTGILTWGREELARADAVAHEARGARTELKWVRAMVDLHRAREAGTAAGGLAAPPWNVCAQRRSERGLSMRAGLLDKLCEPESTLTAVERQQIGIYEHVLEGRWRDASEGLSPPPAGIDAEDVQRLLGDLAATADRSERSLLLELQHIEGADVPSKAQWDQIANLAHPVHRRIAEVLTKDSGRITREEELLLAAYEQAKLARSTSGSAEAGERGRNFVEDLRRLPHGHAYADLALVALRPETKVIESFETGMRYFRDNVWSIGIFMIWPLWRLRRFVQRRSGTPIRSRPNPMRRAVAAVVDIAIAASIGVLAGIFVDSAVGIVASLLRSPDLVGVLDSAGVISGLLAGMAYFLCRDAIRLRFRRSIGKALFDLRPLVTNAADPGSMTVRASIKRNAIPPAIAALLFLLFLLFLVIVSLFDLGGLLISFVGWAGLLISFAALVFLLANVTISWRKDRDTYADKWSKTRVVDADCAEARAIRP